MNFLLAVAQGLFVAVCLYIIICLVAAALKVVVPFKARVSVPLIFMCITIFVSAQSYGPRLTLDQTVQPPTPETTEVETGQKMVDPKDRSKIFSKQLEE